MSVQVGDRVSLAIRATVLSLFAALSAASGGAQSTAYFSPTDSMSAARDSAPTATLEDGTVLFVGEDGLPSQVYDPASGHFALTGPLNEVRSQIAAIRLDDGRVLVVGGWNGIAAVASVELYDPRSRTFSSAGSMLSARARPVVAKLSDGRVLIAGGHDGTAAHGSAELYDPVSGGFIETGSMSIGRVGTATALASGSVLVIGGPSDGTGASAEIYDPALGGFTATGELNIARHGHAATPLADGRVLVTGGMDQAGNPLADAEVYDVAAGTFRLAGRMVTARHDHTAVLLRDGTVLAVGGHGMGGVLRGAELYEPASDGFTAEAALIEPRVGAIVTALPDGGALVAGGRGTNAEPLATAERFWRGDRRRATSTLLASSLPSATYGQPVSYTATVSSLNGTPSGGVLFLDGEAVLGTAHLDAGRATITTSVTPAGTRAVKAQYIGSSEFTPSESLVLSQFVAKAPATASLIPTPIQRQYSDVVTFVAIVSPADAAESVTFRLGATDLGTADVVAGKAVLVTPVPPTMPPGVRMITAVFNQAVPNYAIANVSKSMSILKEDARIESYDVSAYTACKTCNTAVVRLEAEISDISATQEANGDVTPGDIRNATVTFVNRTTYGTIATVPVTLPNPGDTTTGEAVYEWTVDLGAASSKTFKVGYVAGGLYVRSTYDYVTVTVSKPK
jgi:hypothetical protein